MKITGFIHRAVSVPVKYPVVSSVRQTANVDFVLLDVRTDEGATGIAYVQAFNIHAARAVRSCLSLLEQVVAGADPRDIDGIWRRMWKSTRLLGHQGLATFALSMVDIALWDIAGKLQDKPVFRLLNSRTNADSAPSDAPRLPVYMSDGLWHVAPKEAAEQASSFAAAGFASMKMRLGRSNGEDDIAVYREIRRAVGEQAELMGDVNQGWSVEQALKTGTVLEAEGLAWLEEPVEAEDEQAHAELTRTLKLPIATGENLYGARPLHRFIEANAATVYTPDLQRIGGITGWRHIYELLRDRQVRYSIHLFPEYAAHLLAVAERPERLEWMSWAGNLFQQPLVCKEGHVTPPERPGFGMEWESRVIDRYSVD